MDIFALPCEPHFGVELVTLLTQLELKDIITSYYSERLACGNLLSF